jgi:hypothetical protein
MLIECFIRPIRHSYVHMQCGEVTTTDTLKANNLARDPRFYKELFCVKCQKSFPVGDREFEFYWPDGAEVGT